MQPILTHDNFAQVFRDCCGVDNADINHFHSAGWMFWWTWSTGARFAIEYSAGIKVWRLDPVTRRLESTGRGPRTAFTTTVEDTDDRPLLFRRHDALIHARAYSPFALSVFNPDRGNTDRGNPAPSKILGKTQIIPAEADWDEAGLPCYTLRGTFFVRFAVFGAVEFVGPAGLRIDVLVEDYDVNMRAVISDMTEHGTHERGGFRVPQSHTRKFGAALQRFCEPL
jgi:hypothetical protein